MRRTRLKVAVLGASGYTGGELLRLLSCHPYVTVTNVTADKSVGLPVTSLFPHLETFHGFRFTPLHVEAHPEKSRSGLFSTSTYEIHGTGDRMRQSQETRD